MSFSKRPGHDVVYYTKSLDSLKGWNDHFFWVDTFACPFYFSWHTGKSVSKDLFPQSTEFNAEHYASLVAYLAPFHKYPKPFLCLVGISRYYMLDENTYPEFLHENGEGGCCIMNLLSFIRTADPMKVRIGKRQRGEDEHKLLDTTIGRVVPLLPVAPARASSELEASVDKLFEEGGSGSHAQPSASLITMTTIVTSTVDPTTTAKEKFIKSSIFDGDSSSGAEHTVGGFSGLTGSDFIVGGIRTVVSPDTDLQKMVDEFAPPKFFASIRGMEHDELFTEFNARDEKVLSLKAQLLVKEAEATEAIHLRSEVQTLADRNTVLEGEKVHNDNLSDQVHTLEVSSVGLQEKVTAYENFIELAITKCLNSTEYLSTLGLAIGKAIKKGMLEGLSAGITYDTAGRVLTDIAAYNPSAEADSFNERLGLTESQSHVQLMVPIHHSSNRRVIGASALSLSLDSEPLSATTLMGTEVISATIDTPTALSNTLAFASNITPISIEDYEFAGMNGQEAVNESVPNNATGGNVNPFPNVDDVELNVSQ
ncbi:hypothetical protein Tco_1004122 [Tanacetum coccineum]|uniref:Transposase (Putative), gypsy type n=1 Tax=Tanacetum coccineum TaxID=301880 RepID=A0ABQ5FC33_9ASTR